MFVVLLFALAITVLTAGCFGLGLWLAVRAVARREPPAGRLAAWLGLGAAAGVLVFLSTALGTKESVPDAGPLQVVGALLALAGGITGAGLHAIRPRGGWSGVLPPLAVALVLSAAATVELREASYRRRLGRVARAISDGRQDDLARELSGGAGPCPAHGGKPLLVLAAEAGRAESVEALLSSGVDLRLPACEAGPALVTAARRGHVEVVRLLLSRGVEPNAAAAAAARRDLGWPAYMSWAGCPAGVRDVLRQAGARDVDLFETKRAALRDAALAGDFERFQALRKEGIFSAYDVQKEIAAAAEADLAEFVVKAGGDHGMVPTAVRAGARRTFQALLPNLKKFERAETLWLASAVGQLEIVRILVEGEEARERALHDPSSRSVELPIGLDEEDADHRTALAHAARGGHADVVAYLLAHGATRDARLLDDPAVRGHAEVVALLQPR